MDLQNELQLLSRFFCVYHERLGVVLGLANARTLDHAKFANAPPSGLTRCTNAPQLPREYMGAPEID